MAISIACILYTHIYRFHRMAHMVLQKAPPQSVTIYHWNYNMGFFSIVMIITTLVFLAFIHVRPILPIQLLYNAPQRLQDVLRTDKPNNLGVIVDKTQAAKWRFYLAIWYSSCFYSNCENVWVCPRGRKQQLCSSKHLPRWWGSIFPSCYLSLRVDFIYYRTHGSLIPAHNRQSYLYYVIFRHNNHTWWCSV